MLTAIVEDLNQPHDPGTIRPTQLEDWLSSRLMRVEFLGQGRPPASARPVGA